MMSHIEMEYAKTLKQVSQLERELAAEKEWVRQSNNSNARLEKFLAEAQAEIARLKGEIDELRAALAEPDVQESLTAAEQKPMLEMNPQKREWVGLTDDEIEHLRNDQPWWMVRDIEAKLREKNT